MKIERTANAGRNMVFGTLLKIYQMSITFLMRTIMIYFMGVQYLGLNSLFTSILQVLNLAELGVGNAMVYSMYKPIAEDDRDKICALMRLYKIYYRVIGCIIAVAGVILLPFIPELIHGKVPSDINVYYIYLLHLGATVLSYWLFAYKNCLFSAHQRNDIVSKVNIIVNTIQYIIQIIIICFFKNYYGYLFITLMTQAVTNVAISIVATKKYPNYRAEGKLEKKEVKTINQRIKDLFTAKVGAVIVNSADTIVVSAFLGLTALAIYQNYFLILTSIAGFITIIFGSCMAGIGNSIVTETKEKNYFDLRKLTFIISWILCFCTSCLLCLYQTFMKIWVGEKYLLDFSVVICLCIYFFVYELTYMLCTYKDAAGIWHEDRWRPFVTAVCNLIMNVILVQFWGIYGVILSTVLSMVIIGIPWLLHNLFTVLFEEKYLYSYIKQVLVFSAQIVIICALTYFVCNMIHPNSNILTMAYRAIICCIIPNALFGVLNFKQEEFRFALGIVKKIAKKLLK